MVMRYGSKRPSGERTHRILEYNARIVAFTLSLRFGTVLADWLSLVALDTPPSTRLSRSVTTEKSYHLASGKAIAKSTVGSDILIQPVFVRFLIFVFFGGNESLLDNAGDKSRCVKSSTAGPSGAIATESILGGNRYLEDHKRRQVERS